MLSPLDRLRTARALKETVDALTGDGIDPARKVLLERRADGLRAVLLGKRGTSVADLDLFAGEATVKVLASYWDQVKAGADFAARDMTPADVERIRTARYLKIVTKFIGEMAAKATTGNGEMAPAGLRDLARDVDGHDQGQKFEYREAELDRFVAEGAEVAKAVTSMDSAAAEVAAIAERDRQRVAELDAAWKERTEALAELRAAAYDSFEKRDAGLLTREQAQKLVDDYNAAHAEWDRRIRERFNPIEDALRAERQAATLRYSAPASELKQAILSASPVSEAEAADWAAEQRIEPGAVAALKRIGYDPKRARSDIAEFYRLTGGRLSAVKIRASRGRASASGIHGHANRVINMGAGFDKRTLFHELGHHLEADPQVYAAARGFLLRRREGPEVYPLSQLTGNKGYGSKELAFKDHWFHPYVGKDYPYDVTEVFSMGVESWCDDVTLSSRMRQDPEHFKLIAGFMKAPPHELFGSVKKVLAQAADADADVQEAAEETLEQALKRLAEGVEFALGHEPKGYWMTWMREAKYLGRFADIDAWEGKFADPRTNRKRKGIALLKSSEESPGGRVSVQWLPTFSDLEARATARAWKETGAPKYLYNYKEAAALAASLG